MMLCGRPSDSCPGSTPSEVNRIASALTGAVGNSRARGTTPGGAYSAYPAVVGRDCGPVTAT
ncbi:Uncharacterised protein [Mycobacteroides abscessus subsp. abscessus]|nr:Uncharacterised protein [Mycobacteroides abscessus subsp. abscessus]